jgi:hypothetical protein
MGTRGRVIWALGGAAALVTVEVLSAALVVGAWAALHTRPHPPPPVVIASPVPDRSASRFDEMPIPKPGGTPYAIAVTPDGSVWFSEAECTSGIGRLSRDGRWNHWPLATHCKAQPLAITVGPDGGVWYANLGSDYGKVDADGTITRFHLQEAGGSLGIAAGPDGDIWLAGISPDGPFVARVSTEGVELARYALPRGDGEARGIVAGPDGAMWFTTSNGIGRITASGDLKEFPMPAGSGAGSPYQIAAGPDGNLWFVEYLPGGIGRVGRITTAGKLTEFGTPGVSGLQWITAGPDHAMWFTGLISNSIGRIALNGSVTAYPLPTFRAQPIGIASAAGKLWFAEDALDGTGRIASFSIA